MKGKPLKCPERASVAQAALYAERRGIYAVQGEMGGVAYFYNDGGHAIVAASRGTLRMKEKGAGTILAGLAGIMADIRDLRRAGRMGK